MQVLAAADGSFVEDVIGWLLAAAGWIGDAVAAVAPGVSSAGEVQLAGVDGIPRLVGEHLDPAAGSLLLGVLFAGLLLSGPGSRLVKVALAALVFASFFVFVPFGAAAFGLATAAVLPVSKRRMVTLGGLAAALVFLVVAGANWWASGQAGVPSGAAEELRGRVPVPLMIGVGLAAATLVWAATRRSKLDPLRYATAAQRREITERDGYRCSYCGADGNAPGVDLQADHVIPHSAGGPTVTKNLVWSCSGCNRAKGALGPWRGRRAAKAAARSKRRPGWL